MDNLRPTKEQLVSGFDLFLNKHLKVGDHQVYERWLENEGKILREKFPYTNAELLSDEQIGEVFELMGASYGVETTIPDQKKILSFLLDSGISDKPTLSIGCGLAPHEIYLASQGVLSSFAGVDIAQTTLTRAEEIAKEEGVTAQFKKMHGADVDFVEEFDQVLSIDSMHWMMRWQANLRGVARALKPGGTFFLVYSPNSPRIQIDPLRVIETLTKEGMNVTSTAFMESAIATPRATVVAKKEEAKSGLILLGKF